MKESLFRPEAILYHRQRNIGKVFSKRELSWWIVPLVVPVALAVFIIQITAISFSTYIPVQRVHETHDVNTFVLEVKSTYLNTLNTQDNWDVFLNSKKQTIGKLVVEKITLVCPEIEKQRSVCVYVNLLSKEKLELKEAPILLKGPSSTLLAQYIN